MKRKYAACGRQVQHRRHTVPDPRPHQCAVVCDGVPRPVKRTKKG